MEVIQVPSKFEMISATLREQAKDVVRNTDTYTEFLLTAANNYKYNFREQLLIHLQKPTAIACADIDTWNKLGRWVNKGSKGIALIVDNSPHPRLRHVFDVSDTNSRQGRVVNIWQMESQYENSVITALENSFGAIEKDKEFQMNIIEIAGNVVQDNISDYIEMLKDIDDSSLISFDEDKETELQKLVATSVAYMTIIRCGYSAKEFFEWSDFSAITLFNSFETVSILGAAVSDISEMVLREIESTIKDLQRNPIRTFANDQLKSNNEIRKENTLVKENSYDITVQTAGRLPDTEPDTSKGSSNWEIWNASTHISAQPQRTEVHSFVDDRPVEYPSGTDRPAGQSDDGTADFTDEERTESDRAAESRKPDAVGADDEQYQEPGRGDSSEGTDLRIESLPTVEEQINNINEAESDKLSAFSISQEEIDLILCRGSGVSKGKMRIFEQYQKKQSKQENIKFLKDEYGWGGAYPAATYDGVKLNEEHSAKGIHISRNGIVNPEAEILLKWPQVEKRIGELIQAQRYFNAKEIEEYPRYILDKKEREIRSEISNDFRMLVKEYDSFMDSIENYDNPIDFRYMHNAAIAFSWLQKTVDGSDGKIFTLPHMRMILNQIIDSDSQFSAKARYLLSAINDEKYTVLEPTYDELNPPPPPPKEYRFSLGDSIYIGMVEYELVELGEDIVRLYDPDFPLINKEMPRAEFDENVKENPFNNKYLHVIEQPVISKMETTEINNEKIVGAIEYFHTDGSIRESVKYSDAKKFMEDIKDDTYYGVPISIVIYDDIDGINISKEFISSLDPPPKEVKHIDSASGLRMEIIELNETDLETVELPPPTEKKKAKVNPFVLHPEITNSERLHFAIKDDDLGVGTPSERYRRNVLAIKLLKTLEERGELANADDQQILSQYVGWGGLADCFDEKSSHYLELKELLTEDEYASARESTLSAFYTPPIVIKAIYKALENMNFKTGNILEPSCGIGNFMGLLPDSMNTSKLYGVELDSISGRIAQQLYQKSSIAVQGYETTNLPDSFFDAAIGNVPFGQFKVPDKRYDKNNFLIHDYFFAKTLDKVRPGGIIAFITSKGTMDKENPTVRKYIAQRAELLGAIRLPNNTFKSAAGTEVTSDILFLQKRDRLIDIEPEWVHLNTNADGIKMNQYFVDNPDMVIGEMKMVSGPYGPQAECIAYEGQSLEEQLNDAIQNIHAEITEYELEEQDTDENVIPADPTVKNFSYTLVDGQIYFRENSVMKPVEASVTAQNRIKGLIEIRDGVRTLIEYQTEDYPDEDISYQQRELNRLYDNFADKYGRINSRANSSAFSSDSAYFLLTSLEILDDEGNFIRKADMFSKRTIRKKVVVDRVDTASESLAISLAEKAEIDMEYMSQLTGKSEEELYTDLKGVIFLNPLYGYDNSSHGKYLTAEEYLSGNVREKLDIAKKTAEIYPDDYTINVEALQQVQPVDLTASEISVRLGATWLPVDVVQDFMFDLFSTPRYMQWNIKVHYSDITGEWNIQGKSYDRGNVKAYNTYGTSRINGYKIIEDTVNLKDVRIFDYVEDENGKRVAVLNKKETAIAQGKQELVKEAFANWIWKDPQRRERLCKLYNQKFNSIRPREYDGSHLNFVGMNPEITLRKHQVNAIAHIIYGGNTLLAHVVGAGKTYEMVAAAQESKRLGLCQKSLFVVPNHLTEQWASEYLQLYPSANILVATKKDFETKNRKKFCGRIATGDYDAVIIGHSQFEKIPMSIERQRRILEDQLDETLEGIAYLKKSKGDNFSVKQLEKTKKSIKTKLDKLNDQTRKDDVVTFEELGVDRIFIDEAHYYKNLAAFSKMRNVGGIAQTEAMKSSDLYMKCRYLDEITGGRGVIFATGTPISNSMVEMYTMQKYLQYGALKDKGLLHFDAWASTFGETVTAIELAPEGSGYRAKTRFAKFYNLPELMAMFKETADIQTADMLNLPVPKANRHIVTLKPSEHQKKMVEALSERAEKVRNKMVNSSEDNMLLITNDGRKLALDQRLLDDMLPDSDTGKTAACADNVYKIYMDTMADKSTQMIFCDLSTPHNDGKFNVYDDIRKKLIEKGIPEEEIAFIHDAKTEVQKKEMFGKVRSGQIRVLLGSTFKMGAGTNVQHKLKALHHLDCPWRPSDLQQREGRIIRQGNTNSEVDIYTYVTENTFDSYLYQLVEGKQKFIGQIMTSKSPVRSAEDIDETALSYAEIKALCTGNPYIKEKMDLDIVVQKLKLLKANHLSQKYALEDQIIKSFPQEIKYLEQRIDGLKKDQAYLAENTLPNEDGFSPMVINGNEYTEKKEAGTQLLLFCKAMTSPQQVEVGSYRGFTTYVEYDSMNREFVMTLKNEIQHKVTLGSDVFGNIQRIDNILESIPEKITKAQEQLDNTRVQFENAKQEVNKAFPQKQELIEKTARLNELNILLNLDKKENEIVEGVEENAKMGINFKEIER